MSQANAKAGKWYLDLPSSENIGRQTVIRAYLAGYREAQIEFSDLPCQHPFEKVISAGAKHNCTLCGKNIYDETK